MTRSRSSGLGVWGGPFRCGPVPTAWRCARFPAEVGCCGAWLPLVLRAGTLKLVSTQRRRRAHLVRAIVSSLRLSFLGDMGTPRRLAGTPGSGADVALGFRTSLLHRAGRESAGDASIHRSHGGFGVVRVFSLPADSACLPAYLTKPGLPHFSCRSCPSCYGWPSDSSPLRGGKLLFLWSGSLNQIRG